MATLSRKSTAPAYKDYVNFLGSYKGGKRDDPSDHGSDSGISSFPLSSNTSSSSLNSDVPDFPRELVHPPRKIDMARAHFEKPPCNSYTDFLENTKNKKFSSVKPQLKPTKQKTEIFIEIQEQPVHSVSEVSKVFHQPPPAKQQVNKVGSRITMFEQKPKIAEKPSILRTLSNGAPPPPPQIKTEKSENMNLTVVPPPIIDEYKAPPPPPPMKAQLVFPIKSADSPPAAVAQAIRTNAGVPPPPPPPMKAELVIPPPIRSEDLQSTGVPPIRNNTTGVPPPPPMPAKIQATLNGPNKAQFAVKNPNGFNPIDKNDPMVRKLVYGTLRGLYGAYHDKANDFVSTLPRNMVKKDNGVQRIIEEIASRGDLDKLNGRVNPKVDPE